MKRRIMPICAPAAALVLLAASGCGTAGSSSALVIYNGQHEQTTAALVRAFESKTGIETEVRSADEATLGNQIDQEGSSSPADVFYSENSPVLEQLAQKGFLSPVAPSTLAQVPAHASSAKGLWVGVAARLAALAYNPRALGGPAPRHLIELGAARYSALVGYAPSETDFQPLVTSMIRHYGLARTETWLRALHEHGAVYPDNETVTQQVNNGESALGPIDSYYWYRLRASRPGEMHSAISFFAPGDAGDLVDISGAAILHSASRRSAAQRFLAFLVSEEGQKIIAAGDSFEYPLRPGVARNRQLPPLASMDPAMLPPAQLGDGSEVLELEQKLGLL